MPSAVLTKARNSLADTKKTLSSVRSKMREMKIEQRAQRALGTGTAIVGGAAAGLVDSMIDGFEIGGIEVPMSAVAGGAAAIIGHLGEPGETGSDLMVGVGNGALAGAAYHITRTAWDSWE